MLKSLLIKNYALIRHLEMEPSPGLNMITGETGAGKSIMLGAVGLLLGNRADTKVLYDEADKCVIEGLFDIQAYGLKEVFDEEELEFDQQCIIRREVSPSGKSRAFVNDSPVNLDFLKTLGSKLMDVHSQHETLLLGDNNFQLQMVDAFAQNQLLLQNYQEYYEAFRKVEKEFAQLSQEADDIRKESDYNHFLLNEFLEAQLEEGEQERWEEELKKLENAEEIKLKLTESIHLLSTGEFAVNIGLHTANGLLGQLSKFSESYKTLKERLESSLIELKDIASELEAEAEMVEYDEEKIVETKERLSLIYQLQQKHRVLTVANLLQIQADLQQKANKFGNLDDDLKKLQKEMEEVKIKLQKAGSDLSTSRKKVFQRIESDLKNLIAELGMPDATLNFSHQTVAAQKSGMDDIRLLFSANKGIKPQELRSVASGGEFSRLMFAIKYLLADKTALPTIVFDEIDTGISGEIALKMVYMMRKMAQNHQVITISHLPQMAAKGEYHYFVYKDNTSDKAVSRIKLLSEAERIEEIAKMIGGNQPSATAFQTAKELLELV